MANYKKLLVWQKADDLAFQVYKATESFPKNELFGLISQLRRSALSVPTNVVEGYNRKSKRELHRFLDIALGSLAETEYLLEFSNKLGYLDAERLETIRKSTEIVGKLLWSFQKSL